MDNNNVKITINKEDRYVYYLAKHVIEKYNGRKIVTWIRSNRFERVLKAYFNLTVSFNVSLRREICDGKKTRHLDDISPAECYLVVLDRDCDEDTKKLLYAKGFKIDEDCLFFRHTPIILENYKCTNEGYKDIYGNCIECHSGAVIKRSVFRLGGNSITIGNNVNGISNLSFDLTTNTDIQIQEGCVINASTRIESLGSNGCATVRIGERCRFTDALLRLYVSPYETAIICNSYCSFETHFEAHANTGKRIILGKDCMISHNVQMWAGDGHAIFDVVSGDNINSNFSQLSNKKNNLILGDHVWCGAGSFIMNGTNVGVGSIIGAECVLKGSYPNNVTISGNPAKTVRINCAWSRNMDAPNIESINSSYVSQTSETNSPIAGQNVLVIGGTGFSGIRLVQRLIELGNRVTIATRGHKQDVYGYNVNRIILDVTDFDSVKTALANKEYDVVFDDLAYNPLNVYNVLSNVKTKKYVQLSSVMAYGKFHKELDEAELDLDSININLNDWTYEKRKQMNPRELYAKGKRYAEAMAYKISKVPVITVRIPYVFDARPKYYCLHIANDTPMAVKDINKSVVFVRDIDVGNFLPWIAAQDYSGPINFADYGSISIKQIIDYIANKTGKKRIKYGGNDVEPFNEYGESSYSLSLNQINRLGYKGVDVNEWFWGSIDNYIKDATAEVQKVELKSVQPVIIPQIKTGKYANFVNKTGWSGYEKTMLALEGAKCTGCSSCANVCPQNAIRITTDDRGFIVPEIDTNICVNCGLCHKTCPKLNLEFPYPVQSTCYAFMASDELRRVSASGGAFLSCAEYVLDNGGVVFGAAWTEDYGLKHIAVTDKSQLNKIYGSKYLQSSINYAFRTVKDYLLKGKIVLFVGTPCQVDGLRHYLRKDYQNLYTIDLLCRGVPSEELFKRYLKESYGNEKIRSIVQKSKKKLGWGAYTEIIRESGAVENYNMENNIWMKAFLSDFMFRDSCYGCPYPQRKRIGDISMGDFWQIAKYNKSFDDRLGTSFVITNTAKGEALIKSVKSKLLKKVPVEFELPYNSAISSARKVPGNRTLFFDMLQKAPLGAALDRALYGKKYDIGIVGWWSNLNYGGALTYFALYTTVQRLGYSVMMIRPPFSDASMPRTDTVPMRFACKHYVISRLYAHRDMHLLNYACKGFISGSDQLWNPYLEQYAGKECFLSFANQNSLRISYASSFGNVSSFKDNFIAKYKPELKKFDAISVREDYAVELGKKYFDIDAQFVCDPVFLCNRQDYEELAKCSSCGFPGKFILGFILDPNPDKTKAISYITEKKGIGYACFTDLQNVEQRKVAFNLTNVYANHAVEDLIKAYSQCDFVLTDSFHGTCFAIIFNKPFISIKNHERGEKRFESLLRWTGLTNRMVDSVDEIYKRVDLLGSIDYNEVNERVSQFKTKSLEWLKGALKKMKY